MNIKDILNYRPQLSEIEYGAEPSLKVILYQYYIRAGMTPDEATNDVHEYIQALEKHYNEAS